MGVRPRRSLLIRSHPFCLKIGTPWIGIVVGMAICGVIAVLIGIPMLRLSGHYFAIATLLIGIAILFALFLSGAPIFSRG